MKSKIVGTGISGLVGSRITELLKYKFEFSNVSIETGIDIRNIDSLVEPIGNSDAQIILHMAAKTDVDGCEKDKGLGVNGGAWQINVQGTKNIIDVALKKRKKIIYISTDYVFDGENCPTDGYKEEDQVNPENWYGETKSEGEKLVRGSGLPFLIIRIAYPYRANFDLKRDFFRTIKERLETNQPVFALTDHIFTPTLIDDIASALEFLVNNEITGIVHVVGSEFLTPYEASVQIADVFNLNKSLIQKTTREKFFKDRAFRPFKLAIKNVKMRNLGVFLNTFNEGLLKIKRQ